MFHGHITFGRIVLQDFFFKHHIDSETKVNYWRCFNWVIFFLNQKHNVLFKERTEELAKLNKPLICHSDNSKQGLHRYSGNRNIDDYGAGRRTERL